MIAERIVWEFQSAPIREQLRIRAMRGAVKVHGFEREILERRPTDDEIVDEVLDTLRDLATTRPVGMAVGPIPITAIWQWCDRRGMRAEQAEIWTRLLRLADDSYLAEHAKKAAKS